MPSQPLDESEARKIARSCVCFITRKAARSVTQLYDEALRPVGIRSTQLALLNAIMILGPVGLKRLARATVIDRTTLARNLKPLERNGFIRIEPGEDLRERKVTLTENGRSKLTEAVPLWQKAQAKVREELGQEDLDALLFNLSGLAKLGRKG
jgi:DNA-binding MarR family transcriptional regulator